MNTKPCQTTLSNLESGCLQNLNSILKVTRNIAPRILTSSHPPLKRVSSHTPTALRRPIFNQIYHRIQYPAISPPHKKRTERGQPTKGSRNQKKLTQYSGRLFSLGIRCSGRKRLTKYVQPLQQIFPFIKQLYGWPNAEKDSAYV